MAKNGKQAAKKPASKGKAPKAKAAPKKQSKSKPIKKAKSPAKGSKIKWAAPYTKKIEMYKEQGDYFARNVKYAGL